MRGPAVSVSSVVLLYQQLKQSSPRKLQGIQQMPFHNNYKRSKMKCTTSENLLL
jgi:hypothetical protein